VLVDGRPVRSCVTEVGFVGQSEVTTLEGLGTAAKPHPLQRPSWTSKAPMRLLHQRHDHVGEGAARSETARHRGEVARFAGTCAAAAPMPHHRAVLKASQTTGRI